MIAVLFEQKSHRKASRNRKAQPLPALPINIRDTGQ
jgi:hypothetical protein